MKSWSWREELQLSLATVIAQLTGSRYWYGKAKGLSDLKIHIERERAKVTRAFWLKIMWRDDWTCYLCHRKIPFGQAELEHKLALFNGGYTTEQNCFASCKTCNRKKGIKII